MYEKEGIAMQELYVSIRDAAASGMPVKGPVWHDNTKVGIVKGRLYTARFNLFKNCNISTFNWQNHNGSSGQLSIEMLTLEDADMDVGLKMGPVIYPTTTGSISHENWIFPSQTPNTYIAVFVKKQKNSLVAQIGEHLRHKKTEFRLPDGLTSVLPDVQTDRTCDRLNAAVRTLASNGRLSYNPLHFFREVNVFKGNTRGLDYKVVLEKAKKTIPHNRIIPGEEGVSIIETTFANIFEDKECVLSINNSSIPDWAEGDPFPQDVLFNLEALAKSNF